MQTLWLALDLPCLPLEVFALVQPATGPRAVIDSAGHAGRVTACNPAALAAGAAPGMAQSTAAALAAGLQFIRRRPDLEQSVLQGLAIWAQQFTPTVALHPPRSLLLEIGGCLDYFHGLTRLQQSVHEGVAAQGYTVKSGCAPTPLAALWLARCGVDQPCTDPARLESALAPLPVSLLPLAPATGQDLLRLGIRTLGQLDALPRQGLARRFGSDLLRLLDRARGRIADPQAVFVPPQTFCQRLELAWSIDRYDALLFIGRQLSITLAGFLRARGQGVQQVEYRLEHGDGRSTPLRVGYSTPTRQADELVAVLREALARLELPAPVEAVTLQAGQLHRLCSTSPDLFGNAGSQTNTPLLHARLRARLGDAAVKQVTTVADHRPERAWDIGTSRAHALEPTRAARPGWLLPTPRPLPIRHGHPWHSETIACQGQPERLETGWWDGQRVTRDYWIGQGESGRRYWVFQDRGSGEWFLHGWFD